MKKALLYFANKFYTDRFFTKAICAVLVICILTVSNPAAPPAAVAMASTASQDLRFAFLSSQLAIDFPNWVAAFIARPKQTQRRSIAGIRIFPGSVNLERGQEVVFSAVAYDNENEPISGVAFEWTSVETESGRSRNFIVNSTFTARKTGTFTVTARAGGHQAEVLVVVAPVRNVRPRNTPTRQISSRSGIIDQSVTEGEEPTESKVENGADDKSGAEPDGPAMLLPGEGWDDTNWLSADDPGNQPGNPPGMPADDGAGSGNFQLSAPVISLPGRGIDLALNLNYNSRVWNKSGNQVSYDVNYDEPAPGWTLGFGKMVGMGSGGCMLIDADGTRRGYTGSVSTPTGGMSFTGHTTDGSLIDYGCGFNYGYYGSGWSKLPNGTAITYSSITPVEGHLFPTMITDAQGNYISITYRNASGNALIETVTDTMGRVITFQYDSLNRLISVKGPRMQGEDPIYGSGATRTLIKIHYKQLSLNYSFAGGTTPVVRNSTPWVIDSIYYPATNTGYWFNDADSYSSYGMISKVVEQRGMSWSASAEDQGTINPGTMTKQAVYNYPLTAANETGRTNGIGLTDAPTYETLTESWEGMDVAEPAVTRYKIQQNTSPRVTNVIQPNGTVSRQYSYNYSSAPPTDPNKFKDGLVYEDATYVPDPSGTFTFSDLGLTGNYKQVGKSNVTWQEGHYLAPRPTRAEVTDENNQKVSTEYSYGWFNQITRSCDYDNNNTKLRCAVAEYENDPSYIGNFNINVFQSGRHIFNLVKATGIENPDGSKASWTEYEYDNYSTNPLKNAPGVIQHNYRHDPYTTVLQDGACINGQWNDPQCTYEGEIVYTTPWPTEVTCTYECTEFEQVSAYDPATEKRGNVTKVTTYTDAQARTGPLSEISAYDITGNLVKTSSSSSEETSIGYHVDTQYAYPVSQTRGASDPSSPHRIVTSAAYSFETGLVKQTTDANGRASTTGYNPDTLRPVKSLSSTGAYTTFSYDDIAMAIMEEVKESNGTLASKSIKYVNGLGKTRKEESYGPNATVDIVETKYTKFAEEWKQSRPYRAGDAVQWSEKFYDAQGRLVKSVEPDGSETKAFYNETQLPDSVTAAPGNRIRVVDAWGRERWGRYDQQGRITQVVEPNPNASANPTGSVFAAGSLLTKYIYDTIGRLVETEQGSQFRKFKYDDLGRLTRQKLAEQTATLNDAGAFVGVGQTGANWSEAFTYDSRSNLTQKTDARGVRTVFSYQLSGGGDDPLNRIQWRAYDTSGPLETGLTVHHAPAVVYEYMTTGDKSRIKKITTQGLLYEDYTYDVEGRVSIYEQKIVGREAKPLTVSYLYDTLDRVKEVAYPAQWGLAGNPRKIVAHTYDTASRLMNLTVGGQQQASDIVYNASEQTTSIKIGAAGADQVTENYTFDPQTGLLTNQKTTKGAQTLLDLSYDYNRNNSVGIGSGKSGHLTKIINNLDNAKNREYEFDALGRLTKAKGGPTGNLWNQQYSYDRYGNRTNVVATGVAADGSAIPRDGIPNLVYNTVNNRITTTGYEYDVAGNQTKGFIEDGTAVKYEYDAANRLHIIKRASDDVYLQAFQFGSTNARLMDHDYATGFTRMFASVGGTVLAEYHENYQTPLAWIKSYVFLGDRLLSTTAPNGVGGEYTEYNHPDKLSTRLITNQTLGSVYEQTHLPFGTALNAESTGSINRRFTSYDRSVPTGLDYAINRTYDSKQGRFTQIDPIGIKASDLKSPQTLNLYTYCGNDPINHTDPDGLFFGKLFKWIGKIFKAIGKIFLAVAQAVNVVLNNRWVRIGIFILGFVIPGLGALAGIVSKAIKIYNLVANISSALEMAGQILTGKFAQLGITLGFAFLSALVAPLIDGVFQGLQNSVFPQLGATFGDAMKTAWHQFKNKLSNLKTVIIGLVPFMGPGVPDDAEHAEPDGRYSQKNYQDDPLDPGQAGARKHDRTLINAKKDYERNLITKADYLQIRREAHGKLVRALTRGTRIKFSDIAFGGRPSVGSVYSFVGIGYFSVSWGYLKARGY